MSERFIRCPFCRITHDAALTVCPRTGKSLRVHEAHTTSVAGRREGGVPPTSASNDSQASNPEASFAPVAATQAPMAPMPTLEHLVGAVLNQRYRVVGKLGQGGMGAVFEAEHLGLARMVAVKVLRPEQASKVTSVKRFHQEARAAGSIGHGNICEVYDVGATPNGLPFLVMERLYGESLAARLTRERALPIDSAITILTEVLAGLLAAHAKNIVHRDIKPENIFLCDPPKGSRQGTPRIAKIVDFGVSKMIAGAGDDELSLTRTGMVMGTPYYMSNEQARGMRDLDARVDIYACGVMLYELLTGKRPFMAGNYNALLLQIISATPQPLLELRPEVAPELDAVVRKAMQRDRSFRYNSAAEFRDALLALPKVPTKPRVASPSSAPMLVTTVAPLAAPLFAPLAAPSSLRNEPPPSPGIAARPVRNAHAPARTTLLGHNAVPAPAPNATNVAVPAASTSNEPPRRQRPPMKNPASVHVPTPVEDLPTVTGILDFDIPSIKMQDAPLILDNALPRLVSPSDFDDAPTEIFRPGANKFTLSFGPMGASHPPGRGTAAQGVAPQTPLLIPKMPIFHLQGAQAPSKNPRIIPAPSPPEPEVQADDWSDGTEVRMSPDFEDE